MTTDHPAHDRPRRTDTLDPLPAPLSRVQSHCSRSGLPLTDWLYSLQNRPLDACLRCDMADSTLFLTWHADEQGLYETERTADDVIVGPQPAGPVRTAAAIETARVVTLVRRTDTPLQWSSGQ